MRSCKLHLEEYRQVPYSFSYKYPLRLKVRQHDSQPFVRETALWEKVMPTILGQTWHSVLLCIRDQEFDVYTTVKTETMKLCPHLQEVAKSVTIASDSKMLSPSSDSLKIKEAFF
jgi:hypothetical protein